MECVGGIAKRQLDDATQQDHKFNSDRRLGVYKVEGERMNHPVSRKTTWLIWRARLSVPALLARYDDKKVLATVTAFHAGLAILLISAFAWLTGLPLVFTPLGPSAFIMFSTPLSRDAAPRNVICSHTVALAIGWTVWNLATLLHGGPINLQEDNFFVLCSATAALSVTALFLVNFSCPIPPPAPVVWSLPWDWSPNGPMSY